MYNGKHLTTQQIMFSTEIQWVSQHAGTHNRYNMWNRQKAVMLTDEPACVEIFVFTARRISIVQGSGIGPTLWLIMESHLHPVSDANVIFKYADEPIC